jgi:hypothetical protein
MRWLAVCLFAACSHAAPAPQTIESRVATAKHVTTPSSNLEMVMLPPLPSRRGIDLADEKACRAHYNHVAAGRTSDDMNRLVYAASATTGDCRIDTDALFERLASYRVGGCTGVPIEEAQETWSRLAVVASTRARRVAAYRNLAVLAWWSMRGEREPAAWIHVGDVSLRAAKLDPNGSDLAIAAIDAYEGALTLKQPIKREQVTHVDRMLAQIVDGAAGDRARLLRGRLRF